MRQNLATRAVPGALLRLVLVIGSVPVVGALGCGGPVEAPKAANCPPPGSPVNANQLAVSAGDFMGCQVQVEAKFMSLAGANVGSPCPEEPDVVRLLVVPPNAGASFIGVSLPKSAAGPAYDLKPQQEIVVSGQVRTSAMANVGVCLHGATVRAK